MSNNSDLEDINSTYWDAVPFHHYSGTYLTLPANSSGAKAQVAWTTPTWASGTKNYSVIATATPIGTFNGDESNLTMLCIRATSSATGYQTTTNSDFIHIDGMRNSGTAAKHPIILTATIALSPNTAYYAWLLHGIDDYAAVGGQIGVNDASIHVFGLGV